MAWQDRPYYRDERQAGGGVLQWLLYGSVPLFTAFGIRVRAHSSLIIFIVLVLLFGLGRGFTWQDRLLSMGVLFSIVLLHEFGHCFAARWMGGSADDVTLSPIGGLAWTAAPHRPWATFVTVAGGPAVNVVICIVAGTIMALTGPLPNLNPFNPEFSGAASWENVWWYSTWVYQVSYWLLLFNLLPIYPLDGGQLLMSMLWPKFGYYKAMLFATTTGIVGAGLLAGVGLVTMELLLVFIAGFGMYNCITMRRQLKAEGPYAFQDETDYSAAYDTSINRPKRPGRWARRRVARLMKQEQIEREQIDRILAKVSATGMQSLTWTERRALRKATERQRQRDEELEHTYKQQGF